MRLRVGVKKVEKISVYSMHCLALVLALAAGASAFTPPAPSERPLSRRAVINPAMQFDFLKKKDAPAAAPPKKGRGKKGGDFFDDERDTIKDTGTDSGIDTVMYRYVSDKYVMEMALRK